MPLWLKILLAAIPELIRLIRKAFDGDVDATERLGVILPLKSRTELARRSAEARALAKFGPGSDVPPDEVN